MNHKQISVKLYYQIRQKILDQFDSPIYYTIFAQLHSHLDEQLNDQLNSMLYIQLRKALK